MRVQELELAAPKYYKVTLRIYGDEGEWSDVTRILGSDPTHTSNEGGWRYRPREKWNDVNQAILTIIDELNGNERSWEVLSKKFNVEFFIGVFAETVNFGIHLNEHVLCEIAKRKIEVDFDIYCFRHDR